MSLNNFQHDAIMRQYSQKQVQNQQRLDLHRKTAYSRLPALKDLDDQVAAQSLASIRARLLKEQDDKENYRNKIRTLKEKRAELLSQAGFPPDYLELQYSCPICQDTGYVDRQKCSCFKKAQIDLLYSQANLKDSDGSEKEDFSHFSFECYSDTIKDEITGESPRASAKKAFLAAKKMVEEFDRTPRSLLLYGNTGVGKTFLSRCIARELLSSSHSVMYYSAFDLFEELAHGVFSRDSGAGCKDAPLFACDLLIIDDLGTELTNAFTSSSLFLLINERMEGKKSTIISTNMNLETFSRTYSERIFSRIVSNYQILRLTGKDIRLQKTFLGG